MLGASLLFGCLALAPQGGLNRNLPPHLRPQLEYPADPAAAAFSPFVDAQGTPLRFHAVSVGTGDFDGDRNPEVWFVAADGSISVLMPQTADLGRFLGHMVYPPGSGKAAATFHTTTQSTDIALVLDPSSSMLDAMFYSPPPNGGPRGGDWVIQPTAWIVGDGGYEIDTADHNGDGHDDICALLDLWSGGQIVGTRIHKMCMGTTQGYLAHENSIALDIPARCEMLRMLDLDADGRSDCVVHIPGFGVVTLVDDGNDRFFVRDFVPVASGLDDVFVGDANADGRDDFGLVFDIGVLVCLSTPAGIVYQPLLELPEIGALATAVVVDAWGEPGPDLVTFPRDGRHFVIHPFDRVMQAYLQPVVKTAPDAPPPLGSKNPGVLGTSTLVADVDNDGDRDVLLQRPTGAEWVTLTGPPLLLHPTELKVESLGPLGQTGFTVERFQVFLPEEYFALGIPEFELGVFLEDPTTHEQVFWHRMLYQADPQTRSVDFKINVLLDRQNLGWLFNQRYTEYDGSVTAGGPTVLTLHGKDGTRRFESTLLGWDGVPDRNGSAVGVRWKIVASPPLPSSDDQLLPWN